MTKLAVIHSIYDSNFRDLSVCLDKLKADCEVGKVDAVVSICCGKDGIDVRGMGECDIHDVAGYLLAAQHHIAKVLLQSYETVGGERA